MPADISHHCEQQWQNSCVPACIGIILKWRGADFDEAVLHAGASSKGHGFELAVRELQAEFFALLVEEFRQRVPLWFAENRTLLVTVCGPMYVKQMGQQPGGRPSQHGDLAHPGNWGSPIHAIVLIGQTEDGFLALDPYYPAEGQPLKLTDDIMGDIFAASVVVCKK